MTTSLSTLSRELAAEGVALSLEREGELLALFTQTLKLSREREILFFSWGETHCITTSLSTLERVYSSS
jgi:hypothetical protein